MNRQGAKDAKIEPGERLDQIARTVIGAAIEVHRHLGPGYLENVYEEAMAIELDMLGVPFERQAPVPLRYKGHAVGQGRLDLWVEQAVILELKAVDALVPIHKAQVISYLKATGCRLGVLAVYLK